MRAILTVVGLLTATLLSAQSPTWTTQVTDLYPSVSPDGRFLTFQSTRLGRSDIFVSTIDGRDLRHLGGDGTRITPVWSPDGGSIAFVARASGGLQVFTMKADGSGVRQLTSDSSTNIHPHWSRDGARIFFNSNRAARGATATTRRVHNVFSMDAGGGNVIQHTNCELDCTYPVPSPDGRRIVFRKAVGRPGFDWDLSPDAEDSEVFVADMSGANEQNLSRSAAFDGWPTWSPDGTWIAFASNRTGPALVGQIYLVRPDGRDLRQVTNGAWSRAQPSFSPDGKRIYFYQLQEGRDFQFGFIASIRVPE